eukprot:CAMPEP_0118973582 /NCGR_PEP_ID=MMETSP1173-20130426/10501_1 /TAXON_ID=1034831 /ORGANISM="Rhizochromulina marina cf, Strain CCMP1243" /LENGTH=82 /DNA_ID=CAMNT_0006923261 /DNA_START=19 /DNA_END=267 /DNA_ORIENTATION=-
MCSASPRRGCFPPSATAACTARREMQLKSRRLLSFIIARDGGSGGGLKTGPWCLVMRAACEEARDFEIRLPPTMATMERARV